MIIPEWKRILLGQDKFQDSEAEMLAKTIMSKIKLAALNNDKETMIEAYNDLIEVMGKVEWSTRKIQRLNDMLSNERLREIDRYNFQEKIAMVREHRNRIVYKLREKYGKVLY